MTDPGTPSRPLRIALIAHDHNKADLVTWCRRHLDTLKHHQLHATGTTGALIADELGLDVCATAAARSAATSRSARSSPIAASTC